MKKQYVVARNPITISVDDGLAAWKKVEQRFTPFVTADEVDPVLDIEIRAGDLPETGSELIYVPKHEGFTSLTSRASRQSDGSLVLEFRNIDQDYQRFWMRMSPTYDRAKIVYKPEDDGNDPYFLAHALMVAYMLATTGNGTLVIHSSTVVYDGKAYMFQGRSGTGKSTHASLWVRNITGAELMNDDNPIIRFTDGVATAYGSPWSGKSACYRNISAPIGAMVRIVRSKENELRRLDPLRAYASLSPSIAFLPFFTKEERDTRHATIERLVGAVECCEMHCRPDADAARTCMSALTL